jgi:superfamily II RNA helicase
MKYCNGKFDIEETCKYFDFPFELSDFQKWAIHSVVNGKDTMVCAPTGSGKTLPAEFAIKYFTDMGKKVIYTTPIKALSNEKFYSFQKKFPNISFGLLTGDNKFNQEAQVIIATTEILLNTLQKQKCIENSIVDKNSLNLDFTIDIENDVGMVVFDEIHYINDPYRGHVWEKSIMFLPKNVQYLGLSATINKPEKLCEWNENQLFGAKRSEMYLCISNYRNVPLFHYSFMALPQSHLDSVDKSYKELFNKMTNKPVLLKEQDYPFMERNYYNMQKILKYNYENEIQPNNTFVFNEMVNYLKTNNMLPALTFIFSRKQCYVWAGKIQKSLFDDDSKIPSTIEQTAKKILISKLDNWKEYVNLPEFANIVKLLKKGIAVHHSGVTPVFREMIELLYSDGLIRLLIATETFAVGINMGIRSVVFTGLTKYDGKGFRFLHSHEYGQASGRSGRRGKDLKGYVFHLNNLFDLRDNNPSFDEYKKLLSCTPQTLASKLSIDYSLLISLMYTGNNEFETFMRNSMLSNEIGQQELAIKKQFVTASEKCDKKKKGFELLKTSKSDLDRYLELENMMQLSNKKKKKKLMFEMKTICQDKTFENDYNYFKEYRKLIFELEKLTKRMENTSKYFENEISLHLRVLKGEGYIDEVENQNETLTDKGKISANIHEIHSLAMADLMDNGVFNDLSPEEIVSVISVFTGIRLGDTDKYITVEHIKCNKKIIACITKIKRQLDHWYDIETREQTNFTQNYDIQYDMSEFMYKWCLAENEEQCMAIYNEAKSFNIYVGEFVKAILKIKNICKELEQACIIQENVGLLNKLSKIPELILKSIATNQSLYL